MAKKMAKAVEVATSDDGGFKAAEYNDVALSSRLAAINLLTVNFDMKPEFLDHQSDAKLSYGSEVVSCGVDRDTNTVAAIFRYSVRGNKGRANLLRCVAEYVVIYAIPADSPEPAARGYCRNVGRFAAYPYFRSLVAQLFWGASIQLPPLPAIASTAHIQKKKTE
jgi:hypothetical protein